MTCYNLADTIFILPSGGTVLLRLLLVVLLTFSTAAEAVCSHVLHVPLEVWRPYSFLDAAGKPTGLEIDLLNAVAREAGCQIDYVPNIPRKRRLPMFEGGQLDVLLAASDGLPDRHRIAFFTRPYRGEEFNAFVLDGISPNTVTQSLQAMLDAKVTVIVQTGTAVVPIIDKFDAAGLVTRFEDYDKAILLFEHGRGRVLIGDQLAILDAVRADGKIKLAMLPFSVLRDDVCYMLSRKTLTKDDLNTFNQAITRLERRGELRRIRDRYAVKPILSR